MELIDREKIEWYGCNFETPECESENRKCSECSHAECSHAQVMQLPSTKVPDNPTNGDMIKAMFPSLEIANDGLINDNLTGIIAFYGGYGSPLPRGDNYFNRKWWNAPYKGVEE